MGNHKAYNFLAKDSNASCKMVNQLVAQFSLGESNCWESSFVFHGAKDQFNNLEPFLNLALKDGGHCKTPPQLHQWIQGDGVPHCSEHLRWGEAIKENAHIKKRVRLAFNHIPIYTNNIYWNNHKSQQNTQRWNINEGGFELSCSAEAVVCSASLHRCNPSKLQQLQLQPLKGDSTPLPPHFFNMKSTCTNTTFKNRNLASCIRGVINKETGH